VFSLTGKPFKTRPIEVTLQSDGIYIFRTFNRNLSRRQQIESARIRGTSQIEWNTIE